MQETVRRLTEARLRSYHPVVLGWQRPADIRERLESETRALLRQTTDARFGRRLMARLPTPGATDPSRYLDSLIRLPDGSLALTGIRFRGGDPGKPFVDIAVLEGDITDVRLRAVIDIIDRSWDLFSPLCVRLAVPAVDGLQVGGFGALSRVDTRVIAGRVVDVISQRVGAVDGLSIAVAKDMSWYMEYRREYDRFLADDARRRAWTQPETYDALALATRESAVSLIRLHGTLVGVYSMPRGAAHGLHGFRVQEKFLFECARGKGIGAHVECAVIGQLPAKAADVIFGTIENGNLPSRQSAYRLGRMDIAAKIWFTPAGRPGMPL